LKRVNIRTEIPEEKVFNVSEFVFDTENLTLTLGGDVQSLTKKEAQILKILYKFKNQVLPREVILNTVWGQDDYFVGRSLDVFITKLRKYLKDDETIQILNIHGVGFKLEIKA
jgi:DNA-binding response OmpR family regulator